MFLTILSLLVAATQAQDSTQPSNNSATQPTQIAVYPPFPIRSDTNMQHTQRAYDVSIITAISSKTLVYAISCSPWTTMTRFNDVCGTSFVPNVITVTEGPDNWQWTAQGKTLYCTNLGEKTKKCTSVTNSLESYFAPVTGTQDSGDFLAGFLEYFTTMTPVAVNLTAGFENLPSTVLQSLQDHATALVTMQTGTPNALSSVAMSSRGPTSVTAPVLTVPENTGPSSSQSGVSEVTGAAPRATAAVRMEMLFGAAGAVGAGIFGL